jgi:hypothetical protein
VRVLSPSAIEVVINLLELRFLFVVSINLLVNWRRVDDLPIPRRVYTLSHGCHDVGVPVVIGGGSRGQVREQARAVCLHDGLRVRVGGNARTSLRNVLCTPDSVGHRLWDVIGVNYGLHWVFGWRVVHSLG